MASDNPSSFKPHVAMPRRNSLRLPHQPPSTPIPPSLRQSPYLNAPIFKREISSPMFPTEADEKWLQDTVPIASTSSADTARSPGSAKAQSDRRGSVIQSASRHFATPSIAVSPYSEVPSSPCVFNSRKRTQTERYLAHSLAPPPSYGGGCPQAGNAPKPAPLNQTQSESSVPRIASSPDQSYFPRVPPMR